MPAAAQNASLAPVTIDARTAPPAADVTGFGDFPLREVPVSATVVGREQIEASGARRLADLTDFDPSVTDAYNAPGYWDFVSIRGFTLDNRFNYRREGLPVSAETSIPLENKERVEILKGTSGIQAGTSAPGGLVNYVVKRPTQQPVRTLRLEATSHASLLAAADISQRFGGDDAFGLRINAAHERLRPQVRQLDGERSLLAAAGSWRASRDAVLDAEVEWSRKSQPSQAGFSLLGDTLPAVPNPRLNLNNQPWSQPSVFDALTGTLRWEQALNAQWRWSAQVGRQELETDDRLAFPFGCFAQELTDRFCPDGTFDLYDFRSDNERRTQDAAQVNMRGQLTTGAVRHDVSFGALVSRARLRFEPQAFNFSGTGNVEGTAVTPAAPDLVTTGTNRDERSTEFFASDAVRWNERFTTWLGLRHTRLDRESVATDGTGATAYAQNLTTPWIAASYKLTPTLLAYASHGRGVEFEVAPGNSRYANRGQPLPALKSRQTELGLKSEEDGLRWSVTLFQITRPASGDVPACSDVEGSCTRQIDGEARHRGLELAAGTQWGAWSLDGGITLLDAERRGATAQASLNGTRPANVPERVLRARVGYRLAAVPGMTLAAGVSHEGRRTVAPGEAIELPSWTTVDAALHYDATLGGTATRWTVGIDNVFDRRYWRESPYQFSHVYLYPGAPRSLRLAVTAAL